MRKPFKFRSFVFAFQGLKILWKEANFRIHSVIAILVLVASFMLKISRGETLIVLLCIGMVMFAEAINTAVEYLCDMIQPEKDVRIKRIKDISAAAVLLTAFIAALIGLIVFIPYIKELL